MKYGYARCSTDSQDIERQVRDLRNLGAENIYYEYESGAKTNRAELKKLLDSVTVGDVIIATEVSRITRSTKQLCEIIELAKAKQVKLALGSLVVDCTKPDPMTEGMLKMMGVFAEIERNLITERVKSGLENAKSKGKKLGRPRVEETPKCIKRNLHLYEQGKITKAELARLCNISRPTLDKYLRA